MKQNFVDWFCANKKLIKLDFILAGMLIFFLTLKVLDSVCYGATSVELENADMTIAEYADRVLSEYNLLESDYLWFVYKNTTTSGDTYEIKVYPDLKGAETTALFARSYNNGKINFVPKIDDISKLSDNFYITKEKGLNVFTLDLDVSTDTVTISKNFLTGYYNSDGDTFYTSSSYNTSVICNYWSYFNSFKDSSNDHATVSQSIIYTNCANYCVGMHNSVYDFNRNLEIIDYAQYIKYNVDETYGDYFSIDEALKDTDVSTIVFEGANLMNNKTTYTVSTLMNFDLVKVYVNDSTEVKITFKDVNNNTLYSYTEKIESSENNSSSDTSVFNYRFDVTQSDTSEFNDVLYYKDVGFYLKYNNIYNYNTDLVAGSIVYIPTIYYDVLFNNGEIFTGNKFYYDFNSTYFLNLPSAIRYMDDMSGDESIDSYLIINPVDYYNLGYKVGTNVSEALLSGHLYSIKIHLSIDSFSVDNDLNLHFLDTVHSLNISQSFKVNDNYSVGTVVEIVDSNNNDIGYVVVDKNGNIINSQLDEGYSILDKTIYDSNNNVIYNFYVTDKGWQMVDSSGNVIKDYTHVSIDDKIHNANDNADSVINDNFLSGINSLVETITTSLGVLLTSVTGISALFASAFSWLPEPIPQLVIFAFTAVVLFALIRFIRGH